MRKLLVFVDSRGDVTARICRDGLLQGVTLSRDFTPAAAAGLFPSVARERRKNGKKKTEERKKIKFAGVGALRDISEGW